jgi:PBSX family phage terminase large subunit
MTEFALMPNQFDFFEDRSRFAAYIGGIGSGKTFAGAVKVLPRLKKPGYGMIAAPTFPMLRDSTRRSMMATLDDAGIEYVLNKSENIIKTATGHDIIFRSLENEETIRGPNLEWAWIDEAAMVSANAWKIVKGRVREGNHPQAWITTTPKGRNWIWQEWVAEPQPGHALYRTKTTDNKHLPDDFAPTLGYTGAFAQQEIEGEFVSFDGLIYPMFNRETSIRTVDCTGWRTILGGDIGARNPTALLTIRRAGDGRTHIERERYQRNMGSDDITDAICDEMQQSGAEVGWLDPSAKAYIDACVLRGYNVKGANNDVKHGIGVVTTAFADGLTVDPSCVNTIAEFESYAWQEGATEKDAPIKQNDHAQDAIRYALVGDSVPQPTVRLW